MGWGATTLATLIWVKYYYFCCKSGNIEWSFKPKVKMVTGNIKEIKN
jgi:hypothetical protein